MRHMEKYIFFIALISSLWRMSLSFADCDRSIIGGTKIIFSCNSSVTELNFYDLTASQLNNITWIIGKARDNSSRGPFTFIPPNVCFLQNLQTVDFSYNQIVNVDPTQSLSDCFTNVVTLNLQYNNILEFPSVLIYSMSSLTNLYFQGNQLTDVPVYAFTNVSSLNIIDFSYNQLTSFELWALEVQQKADFSHNLISTITNKYFFTEFLSDRNSRSILLTNNTPTINLTDAIYEMYNQCEDVINELANENRSLLYFSWKLALINFGTTQIPCSCDQVYIRDSIVFGIGSILPNNPSFAIGNATCSNNSISDPGAYFPGSYCGSSPGMVMNSSVNFVDVYPRLCKIDNSEGGSLTPIPNITDPLPNISYPHYDSAVLNPGACFLNFTSATTMMIVQCSNESTNSSSKISDAIFDSSYMDTVTRITFSTLISSYPSYLCSLPSGEINLSSQNFTALTDATFPCLDSFNTVILSNNQITNVSMSNGDFQKLTYLDLSSNRLTQLPYSILRPTPTSLRILDLRNNSITQIDLFIYTLKNITIYLDGNPINSTTLINPQNVSISSNSTSSVNVTYPGSIANLSTIIQDSTVATLISCAYFSAVQSTLNTIRATSNAVLLCTCASFTLKEIYLENGLNITQYFNCSNATQLQSFLSLTNASCANPVYIQQPPCNSAETSTSTTTAVTSNTSNAFTSISFTPTTTLIASNETQSTTLPGNVTASHSTTVGGNSSSTGVTTPAGNGTSSGTTLPGGNSSSTGVTTPAGNGTSSGTTLPGGNSSSTGVTTPAGNGTSSGTTLPGGNSSSTGVTTPAGNGTSSGTTLPGGNSSSTGVTTPAGNGTSSGTTLPGGNSSSTGVTTPAGNGTSSGTTLPGGNSSSTGVTTPAGNGTSSGTTLPGGNSSSTGVTTPAGNGTSSGTTLPGGNSSSTGVTTPAGNGTASGTTLPGGNSSSTGVTTPAGNGTSSGTILPGGNSSSTGVTTLAGNGTASGTTLPGGNSSSTGVTTPAGNGTSSGTTLPGGNSSSTGVTTPAGNGTASGTTLPGGNSSSTGVTTPAGNGTSSGTILPGGNSSSTGVTTPAGNGTASGTTLPGGNSSSTGVTTPAGNGTSSGTILPGGNSSSTGVTTPAGNGTSLGSTTSGGNSSTTAIHTGNATVSTTTNPFGNATVSSDTTETEETTVTSDTTTAGYIIPPVQSDREIGPDRTGLIIGLVIGLVGGAILIGGIIAAILFLKSKSAAAKTKKVARAAVIGQGPKDTLHNRVQPRNLRAVRLAPIPSTSRAPLPDVPVKTVAPTTNGTLLGNPNSTLRTTAKGIPIRFDSVRSPTDIIPQYPPNSNALNNSTSFRPINNITTHQAQMPQQQIQTPQPRQNPILNKGGDLRSQFDRKK